MVGGRWFESNTVHTKMKQSRVVRERYQTSFMGR